MNASFNFGTDEIAAEIDDSVAILRFGRQAFDYVPDLQTREKYLSFFDVIDDDPTINTLLTINQVGSFDEAAYAQFLAAILDTDIDLCNLDDLSEFKRSSARSRQIYLHQYSIKRRLDSNTILIDGLQGTVVTPFFGECLAADFRFATEDMCFSLAHVKYGLHPSGALAFFLPRYVGQSKAVELLLKGGTLTAKEALEVGLINEILPTEEFESHCITAAKEISKISTAETKATKLLNASYRRELENYFETESNLYLIKPNIRRV